MPDFTCADCGASFTLPDRVVDRYPGWTPRQCLDCRSGPARTATSSKSRKRSATSRQNLTLADVLDRYHDGPTSGVFTDGSSVPNPGPGGWGAVYVIDGEIVAEAHGHDPDTTNNRMELTALIEGARLVPPGTPATIYTDSNLAVQTMNQWAAGWERNGWKRKTGPIKNLDLVQSLWKITRSRPELTIAWIRAHDGSRWNEYADSLSTAWSRQEI